MRTGSEFVMFDNQDEKDRIIMLATQDAMDFLALCKILFMDGTVESGPVLFDQVYTIHGKISSCSLDKCMRVNSCKIILIHKMILKRCSRQLSCAAGLHFVY